MTWELSFQLLSPFFVLIHWLQLINESNNTWSFPTVNGGVLISVPWQSRWDWSRFSSRCSGMIFSAAACIGRNRYLLVCWSTAFVLCSWLWWLLYRQVLL